MYKGEVYTWYCTDKFDFFLVKGGRYKVHLHAAVVVFVSVGKDIHVLN